jgi:hypothetical protein
MNLWLIAFFFSGRLKVSHATPASSSTRWSIVVISAMDFLANESKYFR